MREFVHTLTIAAPPSAVLAAFFDPDALRTWWQVTRSLCVPRPLGSYAIEWTPSDWRDELLGRLGGVFRGTVIEFKPDREFFVADAYWLPPDGEPLGPMALEVTCAPQGEQTVLRVRQSGCEETRRCARYYEVLAAGFTPALEELRKYLESHVVRRPT